TSRARAKTTAAAANRPMQASRSRASMTSESRGSPPVSVGAPSPGPHDGSPSRVSQSLAIGDRRLLLQPRASRGRGAPVRGGGGPPPAPPPPRGAEVPLARWGAPRPPPGRPPPPVGRMPYPPRAVRDDPARAGRHAA